MFQKDYLLQSYTKLKVIRIFFLFFFLALNNCRNKKCFFKIVNFSIHKLFNNKPIKMKIFFSISYSITRAVI